METKDLTLADAARLMGIHVETMRRLARAGQIETYVVNPGSRRPRFRITQMALQSFRDHGRRTARPEESIAKTLLETPSRVDPMPPSLEDIVPGTMSGAEMIAFWDREAIFDVFAHLNDLIGPDKKYKDSTEYTQALRERAQRRTHE